MRAEHTEFGTIVNRTRYALVRTIFGMATKKPDAKDLFWENTSAEMGRQFGEVNLQELGRRAKIGGAGATRIKNKANVGLDIVQRVATAFNREPWQMLIPNLEPPGSPVVTIAKLQNAAALGKGKEPLERDQIVDHITLTQTWVTKHVPATNPAHLRIIPAFGDSMKPTLKNGDLVLVDTSRFAPDVDGIYVLRDADGGLLIKRVTRTAKGPVVTSDNKHAPPFGALADGMIVGRVVWAWNGKEM